MILISIVQPFGCRLRFYNEVTALAPVSAVLLAFVILGEPVSINQLAGIGCVLVAVLSLAMPHFRPKTAGQTQS